MPIAPLDRTVYIDPRIGSKDLYTPLMELNVPVAFKDMESADIRFIGLGQDSQPVQIGIERKRLKDALNSMRTGRFMGFQAVRLAESCQDAVLLVEGAYRAGESGELEMPIGRGIWKPVTLGPSTFTYRELDNWLNSIAILTPIRVIRSNSVSDTCRIITDLWHWWGKPIEAHKSAFVFHKTTPTHVELAKPSFERCVAKELDGVGWEKSRAVVERFPSVLDMVMADPSEWERLPGIGKVLAQRIHNQLNGIRDTESKRR